MNEKNFHPTVVSAHPGFCVSTYGSNKPLIIDFNYHVSYISFSLLHKFLLPLKVTTFITWSLLSPLQYSILFNPLSRLIDSTCLPRAGVDWDACDAAVYDAPSSACDSWSCSGRLSDQFVAVLAASIQSHFTVSRAR